MRCKKGEFVVDSILALQVTIFVITLLVVAREPHTAERTKNIESAGVNAG